MATAITEKCVYDPTWDCEYLERIAFTGDTYEDAAAPWHEFRSQYVGASDVGAILGKSPFTSPYEVWQRKTGKIVAYPDTEAMYWGRVNEPVIANEYQKRHPNLQVLSPLEDIGHSIVANLVASEYKGKLRIINAPSLCGNDDPTPDRLQRFMYRNKNISLGMASPDRIIVDKATNEVWGLEIKTSASFSGWERGKWGIENSPNVIPYGYYLQILWSMMVLNLDRWDMAVLLCGNSYREYTFFRNKDLEQDILKQIEHWWEAHVEGNIPPPMSGHPSLNSILRDAYPHNNRTYIQADDDLNKMLHTYVEEKDRLDQVAQEVEARKQELKARIEDNRGIDGREYIADWIRYDKRHTQWKEVAEAMARTYLGSSEIPKEILEQHTRKDKGERFTTRPKATGP